MYYPHTDMYYTEGRVSNLHRFIRVVSTITGIIGASKILDLYILNVWHWPQLDIGSENRQINTISVHLHSHVVSAFLGLSPLITCALFLWTLFKHAESAAPFKEV